MWIQSRLNLSTLALFLGVSTATIANSPQTTPPLPMVTFNLVALDSKGAPLHDLQAADLRIYDDGKLMQAAFCRPLVTTDRQTAPLGPREYSNRPTAAGSESILLLLDLLNANIAERGQGWNDIVTTFQKLESGDSLYLYLLTKEGTFYPIHPLPVDRSSLRPGDTGWIAQVPALLDKAMKEVDRLRPQDFQVDVDARVRTTLNALENLSSDFASQPGGKSLVWISHGVPISATGIDGFLRDYTPQVMRLGTDFARDGITVYAVDQEQRASSGFNSADTMQELAGLTAGEWINSNATGKAIQLAAREGRATYQVAYVPLPERWDNKFHKLRVTTANKGPKLRAVEGYFGDARESDPKQRVALATLGGADDPGIGIRATAAPSEKVKGWDRFQIRLDPADLKLTPGEAFTGEVTITLAYYSGGWEPDVSPIVATKLHLTPAEHDAAMRDGITVSVDRPIPAGVNKVRIIVQDKQSDAVGSLTIPLPVAPKA